MEIRFTPYIDPFSGVEWLYSTAPATVVSPVTAVIGAPLWTRIPSGMRVLRASEVSIPPNMRCPYGILVGIDDFDEAPLNDPSAAAKWKRKTVGDAWKTKVVETCRELGLIQGGAGTGP